jgi:hypothetical protein
MAEYSRFLGRKVTVRYRVGEMLLSASGTFAADSGRSIFLEQHLEQRGQKYFRWEIPYPYIYRIEDEVAGAAEDAPVTSADRSADLATARGRNEGPSDSVAKAAAAAGDGSGRAPSLSPLLDAASPLEQN